MLTKEKPPIKLNHFPETEKSKKPFYFLKKRLFLIGFFVILGMGFGIYSVFPEPQSQEDQLTDLINRIESGEDLPSGEMRDYCHLMAVLRDSISPQCVCVLDGINWDNPPKNPEKLPKVWELIQDEPNNGNRLRFQDKTYTKIVVGFDATNSNGDERPHWHRENPNKKKGQEYLDQHCNTLYAVCIKIHTFT